MMHVSGILPTHPITGQHIHHPLQIHPLMVRVRDNADRLFSEDPRWAEVEDDMRQFGFRTISQMCGNSYPALDAVPTPRGIYYSIRILPKLTVPNLYGIPQPVSAAFVPLEYLEVSQPLRFMEAR